MSAFFPNSATVVDAPAEQRPPVDPTLPAGGTPPGTAPPANAPAADASVQQSDFTVSVPENIAELRKDNFFDSDKTFAQDINVESPEVPPEQLQAVNTELRRMAGDVGLSSGEVRDISSIAKGNYTNPPSAEQQDAWRTEATENLSRTYGSKANEALELARKLVARDPRVLAVIESNGLGSHPRVVAALVRRAYDEQKRGRL